MVAAAAGPPPGGDIGGSRDGDGDAPSPEIDALAAMLSARASQLRQSMDGGSMSLDEEDSAVPDAFIVQPASTNAPQTMAPNPMVGRGV